MRYEATIGLEVHAQLRTASKLFCGCPTAPSDHPNTNVCPVCLGHPGTLPRLNREALRLAIDTAHALDMEIARRIRFDRKHYFYPDLSKNFQTSQCRTPVGEAGRLEFLVRNRRMSVRLREAHLEEDAAKIANSIEESMIDFNRGGVPLLEIVTEPDMHLGEEAEAFLRELRVLLRAIGASDANAELGQLRCDVNISVARRGHPHGTRVELKNLNSPRFVRLAAEHEFDRQSAILEAGGRVARETRAWNESRGATESMRLKEEAHDYRYLYEPDICTVEVGDALLADLSRARSELPRRRADRFVSQYGLARNVAADLASDNALAAYFERVAALAGDAPLASTWIANQVRELGRKTLSDAPGEVVPAERLAELLVLVREERVSPGNAKRMLGLLAKHEGSAESLLAANRWAMISDRAVIGEWVGHVMGAEADAVASFRAGKSTAFQFLVGRVLARSAGQANPRIVREEIQSALDVKRIAVVDMGGAITAARQLGGALAPAPADRLGEMLVPLASAFEHLWLEPVPLSHELSENITPREWFGLWCALSVILEEESCGGVVVTHGLDTLPYTATLMRWLLPNPSVPVVFTGAVAGPDDDGFDGSANLEASVRLADSGRRGFWVLMGGAAMPAVNLQMTGLGPSCFTARNLDDEGDADRLAYGTWEPPDVTADRLEHAAGRTALVKVYPGFEPAWLDAALAGDVRHVVLELFDTGTGNTRWGVRQSLLPLVRRVSAAGGTVFCTSQLGLPVNLENYESSQDLWKAGVVPLGRLTTESAYTKLVAAQLYSGDRDDIIARMTAGDFTL